MKLRRAFLYSLTGSALGHSIGLVAGLAFASFFTVTERQLEGSVIVLMLALGFVGLLAGYSRSLQDERSPLQVTLFGFLSAAAVVTLSRAFMESLGPSFASLFLIFVLVPSLLAIPLTFFASQLGRDPASSA